MEPSVIYCYHTVNLGLSEFPSFDQVLAAGDLEKAAVQLVELWNKLFEPTQMLTNLYDGELWRDWAGRDAFEENLKEVFSLLHDSDEEEITIATLEQVRNILYANFSLLRDCIHILAADIGMEGLRKITLSQIIEA